MSSIHSSELVDKFLHEWMKVREQFLYPVNSKTIVKCNELINTLSIMLKNNGISLTVLCRTKEILAYVNLNKTKTEETS